MATALSPQDVERLLSEPSPDLRAELADKVSASLTGQGLEPGEILMAQDIVRILARDVEANVRAAISHGLRHSPHLPRDVARRLSADIDLVAMPVLSNSLVLTDEDLVELIGRGSARKHATIAGRPNLGAAVSAALITHAEEPAVAVLMDNRSAEIADHSLDHAVTRFSASERVTRAMVLRDSLPITVAERLVAMVSNELQRHLGRCTTCRRGSRPTSCCGHASMRSFTSAWARRRMSSPGW